LSRSFVSTLASAVLAVFDDARALSFTAVIGRCWTATVTVASAQLDGVVISQIR